MVSGVYASTRSNELSPRANSPRLPRRECETAIAESVFDSPFDIPDSETVGPMSYDARPSASFQGGPISYDARPCSCCCPPTSLKSYRRERGAYPCLPRRERDRAITENVFESSFEIPASGVKLPVNCANSYIHIGRAQYKFRTRPY